MKNLTKKLIITVKSNKLLLTIAPFVVVGLYFFLNYTTPLYIIHPTHNTIFNQLRLLNFNDKIHGGNSEIQLLKATPKIVQYKYILREAKDFSKSNIRFNKIDDSYIDLSPYQYLKVKIKASHGTRIPFCISSYVPNHSKENNENSYIYATENINVSPKSKSIILTLKELSTPDWWFTSNNKTEADFEKPDFSKVKYLYFSNCINLKKDIADEVIIEEASFHVDFTPIITNATYFIMVYFGFFLMIISKKKTNRNHNTQEIYFQYKKIEDSNHYDKEEELVLNFIKENYKKTDLTIIEIQNAIGIHERKISLIVKTKTGLLFKQYLNILRIEDAKKLLKNTQLPVSEIGYQVGYGNVSHFNRVFKEVVNCSPNDFRKEL